MPVAGRYFLPDQPLHVIRRGNSRGPIFFDAADRTRYRGRLADKTADYRWSSYPANSAGAADLPRYVT